MPNSIARTAAIASLGILTVASTLVSAHAACTFYRDPDKTGIKVTIQPGECLPMVADVTACGDNKMVKVEPRLNDQITSVVLDNGSTATLIQHNDGSGETATITKTMDVVPKNINDQATIAICD